MSTEQDPDLINYNYVVGNRIARDCLKLDMGYDHEGRIWIEMCGERWEFPNGSDAETIEEISKIWSGINYCMWDFLNKEILRFIAKNKGNFN